MRPVIVPPSAWRNVDKIQPGSRDACDLADDGTNTAVLDFEMARAIWNDQYSASSFPETPPEQG
jgi:hypothetical protein